MEFSTLHALFRYCPKTGRLYRGRRLVKGTKVHGSETLVVGVQGKMRTYARVCFLMYYGYLPKRVGHKDGDAGNNRPENLIDKTLRHKAVKPKYEGLPTPPKSERQAHAGKYRGVFIVNCQYSGRYRGYRGAVYCQGKRHYTPVVETPEIARDMLLLLTAHVEWLASQKETAQ